MKLQVTHFQQWLFENRVIFTLQSRVGGWPGGGLVRAPALQVDAVWDEVPPALSPHIRVILTCHQPFIPSPLLSLSSHPPQLFYSSVLQTSSPWLCVPSLRVFQGGLWHTRPTSFFKTALNHSPGPVEMQRPCDKLPFPLSTPSPWPGNNCLSLTQPWALLRQPRYLVWKYKLDQSSFSP